MEVEESYTKKIRKVSYIFGVNFWFPPETRKCLTVASILLAFFFVIFTIFLIPASYVGFNLMNSLFFVTFAIQLFYPLFVEICINIEAYRKRNIEEEIVGKFLELEKTLKKKFDVDEMREVKVLINYFFLKFLILIVVRILKIQFSGVAFSFVTMIPELVCSASDYSFSFYVDLLSVHIKSYARNINPTNVRKLKVEKDFTNFCKLAQAINDRFFVALLLNIISMVLWTIISFYWIFVRIAVRRNVLKGFALPKFYENFKFTFSFFRFVGVLVLSSPFHEPVLCDCIVWKLFTSGNEMFIYWLISHNVLVHSAQKACFVNNCQRQFQSAINFWKWFGC